MSTGSWSSNTGPSRIGRTLVMAGLMLSAGALSARADCQEDVSKLMQRRQVAVESVNKSKGAGGKLDPILACPRLRTLAAIEGEATAYFTKNQQWCNLPPDLVERISSSAKRTAGIAGQACTVAVKVKEMQKQAQQQQQDLAPKLPTGPL